MEGTTVFCLWVNLNTAADYYIKPLFATYIIVVALYMHVIVKCIVTSLNTSHKIDFVQLAKLWKSYRILFLVGFMFIVTYLQFITQYAIYLARDAYMVSNALEWLTCLVLEFIKPGEAGADILKTCGNSPTAWVIFAFEFLNNICLKYSLKIRFIPLADDTVSVLDRRATTSNELANVADHCCHSTDCRCQECIL